MKCKICNKEINLVVFGLPDDLCWGCANTTEKNEALDNNISDEVVQKKIHERLKNNNEKD